MKKNKNENENIRKDEHGRTYSKVKCSKCGGVFWVQMTAFKSVIPTDKNFTCPLCRQFPKVTAD